MTEYDGYRDPDVVALIVQQRKDLNEVIARQAQELVRLSFKKKQQEKADKLRDYWGDNHIQFPRLISEIAATQSIDFDSLGESMDLDATEINELFERAMDAWEAVKGTLP